MRANKLYRRPKAKNGEGRQAKIKHILIPEEVADELELYKAAYEVRLGLRRVTYEQMLRRWIDNVRRFDADVADTADVIRRERQHHQDEMAADLGTTPEQLAANKATYNPTDPALEPWALRYFFERDGNEVDATPGDWSPFYATINGIDTGYWPMINDGWQLMNEIGATIDYDAACHISAIIKKHNR